MWFSKTPTPSPSPANAEETTLAFDHRYHKHVKSLWLAVFREHSAYLIDEDDSLDRALAKVAIAESIADAILEAYERRWRT